MKNSNYNILPPLKWAGGKRWLVNEHLNLFPKNFNRYIEPFFGSGAVFFKLQPPKATLSDLNSELIETYKSIKSDWRKVFQALKTHQRLHTKDYYYKVRAQKLKAPYSKAARFIYLNRTCWNGLYRVNLQGNFNVPIGTKTKVILDSDDFEGVAKLLKNSRLLAEDFKTIIEQAKKGDFLFVDPPYTGMHNQNNFIKYNEKLFSLDDQIHLNDSLVKAKKRGVKILLTNACHPFVKKLYKDHFEMIRVSRKSVIAANPKNRTPIEEFVITT